jgi:N-acetyl-S-(2-succino)cysteine monooxygenase
MSQTRHAHFTVFITPDGYHEAGWRVGTHDPQLSSSLESYAQTAATAERGVLDAIFMADRPALSPVRASFFPQVWYDPLIWLTALGMSSRRIGLIGTGSTTYSTPYELARQFATADHATHGRIGWNVVTTHDPEAARNFGMDPHPKIDDRYDRATEFAEIVRQLWDAWEDDAVVTDRATGMWADTSRIHPPGFHGSYYDVAGALPVPRSPQGRPVLVQAGSSPAGVELAGRIAELVFTPQANVDAGVAFRQKINAAAERHGRSGTDLLVLPGIAYVLASTEAEATAKRAELEASVDITARTRNLAYNAGIDPDLVDPDKPLDPMVAETAGDSSFAKLIVSRALETRKPLREIALEVTGLPGGLEFSGTPEQMADLVEEWITRGASDGFTLQPATIPESLELFVDHVIPILQDRGLHRREYTGTTLRDHLGLARPATTTWA